MLKDLPKEQLSLKKLSSRKFRKRKYFRRIKTQSNGDAYDRTGTVFFIPEIKRNLFWTDSKMSKKLFRCTITEMVSNTSELFQQKIIIPPLK
ncbi:PNGase F N-terminal domain-containing protein [Flavobacterium sp. B17]|uniref:PNGase F N-terminal domain-containing protein n=1 Tax=Flavobacterium sp. B17 TaxID=95618 RepID=UPI0034D79F85